MVKTNTTMVNNFFEDSHQNVIIDNERKKLLKKIAKKIAANYVLNNNVANINFICTHNSRRSQLGQV